MTRQLMCASAICVLLSICAVVKSEETVEEAVKKQQQLHADVFLVKEGVDSLQRDVEILSKKSDNQIKLLKDMQSAPMTQTSDDGVCTQITGFYNSTLRKYNQFEDRIITKLDEIQEEQTAGLNKILVKQNLSRNCQQGSALDIMSEALAKMIEKIDKFETQLKTFETIEEKLKQQQNSFETMNGEQMKMLKEIAAKLSQQQEKFDNFEKQLPSLLEVTKGVNAIATEKKHKLPMGVILGLTQNQSPPKTK